MVTSTIPDRWALVTPEAVQQATKARYCTYGAVATFMVTAILAITTIAVGAHQGHHFCHAPHLGEDIGLMAGTGTGTLGGALLIKLRKKAQEDIEISEITITDEEADLLTT